MKRKYSLAAAAVSTMAFAALGLATLPASAAPIITDGQTTDLVIHKYLGPVVLPHLPNDGNEVTGITLPPLDGIQFDVYKVNGVDLTTNAGWEAAASLYGCMITSADVMAGSITCGTSTYTLTAVTSGETASGAVTFADLAVGLYVVNENLAASSYASASSISPAPPFFVTLPMTDTDGLDNTMGTADDRMNWLDTVHVYPKNSQDSITKTVADGNQGTANEDAFYIGEELTYTLSSTITATDSNGDGTVNGLDIGYYYVGDQLSTDVNFVSVTASILAADGTTVVPLEGCDAADLPITAPPTCDYIWTLVEETTVAPITGDWVRVVFTDAGLNKLAANSGGHVVTKIIATVESLPADGIIPNMGDFIPSQAWWMGQGNPMPLDPGDNTDPGTTPTTPDNIPSSQTLSKYGNLTFTKTAEDGTTALAGAEFTVYRDINNDENCTDADVTGTGATIIGSPVVTGADGKATFVGLLTSDFYNNAVQTDLITYCLVETKAPTGYNLLADPIKFTVMSDYEGTPPVPVLSVYDLGIIKNLADNLGNDLPLTGGQGVAALSVAGLLLIGGGGGYYAYTSRKRRTA